MPSHCRAPPLQLLPPLPLPIRSLSFRKLLLTIPRTKHTMNRLHSCLRAQSRTFSTQAPNPLPCASPPARNNTLSTAAHLTRRRRRRWTHVIPCCPPAISIHFNHPQGSWHCPSLRRRRPQRHSRRRQRCSLRKRPGHDQEEPREAAEEGGGEGRVVS